MKSTIFVLMLSFALPAWAARPKPAVKAKCVDKKALLATKAKTGNVARPAPAPSPPPGHEVVKPSLDDPDHDRILHLQEALDGVVHGTVLGRLRVGMRVEDLTSGRALYGWRSSVLMDPASNQKVLSTTAALLRLGSAFRFRTEVTGAPPNLDGSIAGDLVIRGSGDPSLRSRHIDELASVLVQRGVTRVTGAILGDPRRIGCEDNADNADNAMIGRSPLRVGSASVDVRVRPGDKAGGRPLVSIYPASEAFVVVNQAETRAKGKSRLDVLIERAGSRFSVVVRGRIATNKGEVVIRKTTPSHALFAAIMLRQALIQAGVSVEGGAGIWTGDHRPRVASLAGRLMALGPGGADVTPPLAQPETDASVESVEILALHESDPLPLLLRRVNKDSDNEWAERVLEAVGAEVYGGTPSTSKGVRVLRESLTEMGLPATAFVPSNGSGLGHQNRVTAAGMAELLRRIYFDPRLGPEIMQSLSVGGVDGTTRNRFHGSSAAHGVRAKTGTLTGVSCLSGFVGDGPDVLVFSILVEGHRKRAVTNVRSAQVVAVNAMMRFARKAAGPLPVEEGATGGDLESGEEADEGEEATPENSDASDPEHSAGSSSGGPVTRP
jgi:D-alanyl-D-alanine carboxypeptidase/D-alanyl-D-alanine-endopeptidase (penicillin-binding protein 4)